MRCELMGPGAADHLTPLVLTYNEEANLDRTLASLTWAKRAVVLDSGSTDDTERIARSYAFVDWQVRPFDNHGNQWRYGIELAQKGATHVLALDADMAVRSEFTAEFHESFAPGDYAGAMLKFEYRFLGRRLMGSLLAPQLRLLRVGSARTLQVGHTQKFEVDGRIYTFRTPLIHDDRKTIERWVSSQIKYSALEAHRLIAGGHRFRDKIRSLGIMPPISALLAYVRAGGPLVGAAAARYAYERAVAESLIAIRMLNFQMDAASPSISSAPDSNGQQPKGGDEGAKLRWG
jgi:hypothetical protein